MSVEKIGPLNVRRMVMPGESEGVTGDKRPLTLVLMHGFGAPGDDLVGLTPALRIPAGSTVIFPEAPIDMAALGLFGARAWWLIDMAKMQRAMARGEVRDLTKDVPEGLAEAREMLGEMLDVLAPERLVIGGFSQGSMLATDYVLRNDRKVEALVVLSGTLLAEQEWIPRMPSRKGLRVFQSHGRHDEILPFAIAKRFEEEAKKAGMNVSFTEFQGGHGIGPEVMRDLNGFLADV